MPVYEYACKSCGEHLEVAQSFKDEPLTTCPACGGPLRKVFGSIGISFKGSGFYRTDSRTPAKKEPTKADAAATADTKAKSETSSTPEKGESGGEKTGSGEKSGSGATATPSTPSTAAKTA